VTAAVLSIFVWLIFAASAFAQDRTQLLDVVVTDAAGRPVPDLSAADFEIYLDGRPQHILGCSYETSQQTPPATPMLLRPPHQAAARHMVLVIDDLSLSSRGADQIRQTLRHYTDEQMRPGDELVIMRTSAGSGGRQQFT
jgi:VWFA-related protein